MSFYLWRARTPFSSGRGLWNASNECTFSRRWGNACNTWYDTHLGLTGWGRVRRPAAGCLLWDIALFSHRWILCILCRLELIFWFPWPHGCASKTTRHRWTASSIYWLFFVSGCSISWWWLCCVGGQIQQPSLWPIDTLFCRSMDIGQLYRDIFMWK